MASNPPIGREKECQTQYKKRSTDGIEQKPVLHFRSNKQYDGCEPDLSAMRNKLRKKVIDCGTHYEKHQLSRELLRQAISTQMLKNYAVNR